MQLSRTEHPLLATRGFTLIETVLAIGIAIGMMVVVLYFYQQTSSARSALLQETEKITAIRRIMDRITADLRGAIRDDYLQMGILGGPDYIQMLTPQIPPLQPWNVPREEAGNSFYPQSDLVEIGYVMRSVSEGTNSVPGLMRWQEPFLESAALLDEDILQDPVGISSTNFTSVATNAAPGEDSVALEAEDSNGPSFLLESPVLPQIRFLRFRYYDGVSWWDSWEFTDLPLGVEITLASEPMPEEEKDGFFSDEDLLLEEEDRFFLDEFMSDEEASPEIFRRIVYLPGSMASFQASVADPLLEEPVDDGTSAEEPAP